MRRFALIAAACAVLPGCIVHTSAVSSVGVPVAVYRPPILAYPAPIYRPFGYGGHGCGFGCGGYGHGGGYYGRPYGYGGYGGYGFGHRGFGW